MIFFTAKVRRCEGEKREARGWGPVSSLLLRCFAVFHVFQRQARLVPFQLCVTGTCVAPASWELFHRGERGGRGGEEIRTARPFRACISAALAAFAAVPSV